MRFKDIPIQRKLMSMILITSAIVLVLMCTAYIVIEYYAFRQQAKRNVTTLGAVIASNSSAALAFDSPKDANEILYALKAEEHIVSAALYNKDGKLLAKYPSTVDTTQLPATPGAAGYKFNDGFLSGFQPVMQEGKQLGMLYIKSDLEAMYEQLRQYALIGILLILGSLTLASIFSRRIQKTISDPILALKETARTITEKKDYSVRAIKDGNDEVGDLTDAFNLMLTEIEMQNREITSFNQKLELTVEERTAALKEQKEFVETIINSSVDIVAVFDRDLNFIMLNERAHEFYNKQNEEIIGKYILDVFPQTEHSGMYAGLTRALMGNAVHDTNYKSPILNNYFENFYIPLKAGDGKVYGVLAIGHNITKLIEANEKLENVNAELLKSNRDLEQFAYIASHDLQEPLRKIQTFTQMLGGEFANEEHQKKYQAKISQAALRMQNLIRDVLNFSRISNSDDAFTRVDLNEILSNVKADFELILQEKEAVINQPELPVIQGIPLQLSQLFSNLISNSLKYADKKPMINISVGVPSNEMIREFSQLNNSTSYIQLTFKDNGIGFEPEFSERIFKIFQRLHGKQSYSGTGIGLALCKKIVENHHGIIFAHSEPGNGATFTVILPA